MGTLHVTPDPVGFGTVAPGLAMLRTVTLINDGEGPLTVSDYFVLGGDGVFRIPSADAFGAVADDDGRLVLTPGESHAFDIRLTPEFGGPLGAALVVRSDDPTAVGGESFVSLEANSDACLEIAPHVDGSYDFGARVLGSSETVEFSLSNCGPHQLTVTDLTIEDDASGSFAVIASNVPFVLEPAETKPFNLVFEPDDASFVTGTLVARYEGPDASEERVLLRGRGTHSEPPIAVARCTVEASGAPPAEELFVLPLAIVVCDASGSIGDHEIVEYIWSVAEAPAGSTSTFTPEDSEEASFFVDLAGRFVLILEVVDSRGAVSEPARVTLISRPDEDIHVELVWSTPADPDPTDTGFGAGSDMDLHLLHPNGCWEDASWDCHFRAREPNWGDRSRSVDDPSLDIDDTDGAGPENINLDNPEGSTRYTVGVNYDNDHGYGVSYATVRVYIFGELVFQAESDALYQDEWWVVATVEWASTLIEPVDEVYPAVPPCDP